MESTEPENISDNILSAAASRYAHISLVGILILEALNYAVHVILRPEPWNASSVSIGYALWALQLACFVRLQLGDPGSVSASWEARAAAGEEATVVCVRSGRLVPTRARYCRRANTVVLGLDHYCHWLGTPVGFGNRKLFVLFVGYSAAFCGMGFVHSLLELGWGAPTRLGLASLSRAMRPEIAAPAASALDFAAKLRRAFSRLRLFWCSCGSWLVQLLAASHSADHLPYMMALIASVPLNAIACILLSMLTLHQLALTCFNRTTIDPSDARFDVGLRANWSQVFGARALLWALPLMGGGSDDDASGSGPVGDGYHWAESERWLAMARRKERLEKGVAEARIQAAKPKVKGGGAANGLLVDPPERPKAVMPPPAGGRWALGLHQASMGEATLTALAKMRKAARWWEEHLCCGLMAIGSLRLGVKLNEMWRQRRMASDEKVE